MMMLNSVVFPAPLGPIMPVIVPRSTWTVTPSTALMPPEVKGDVPDTDHERLGSVIKAIEKGETGADTIS
jgi:hypothetical protein